MILKQLINLLNIKNKFFENEIYKKSFSAFILKIIGTIFGYLFLFIVTKKYGAEAWGSFTLSLMLLNIFSIFSRLGIDQLTLKKISSYDFNFLKINKSYSEAFIIVVVSSIVFSFLLFFFSSRIAINIFSKPELIDSFKLVSLMLVPFSLLQLNSQVFRGLKKIILSVVLNDVIKFLLSIIVILLVFYVISIVEVYAPFFSFSIAIIIACIVSFLLLFKNKIIIHKIENKLFRIVKESAPMMYSASILLIISWIDTLMIGVFMKTSDVGIYNTAVKIAMSSSLILISVNSIVAPKLSESFNNNRINDFKKIIYSSVKLIFYFSMPIILVIMIFPEFFLGIFGVSFLEARISLIILLFGQIINVLSGSVGIILNMTGKQKVFRNILFFSLFINIILNYVLIPRLGLNGAAIASTVSFALWNFSSVIYIYKKYNVLTFFNPFN